MKKVSLVVIGFNIENYIERCINSIINQTYSKIEIIFVNDGSTDNTLSIVQNLAKQNNNIKIIDKKNSGANAARKCGYKNVTGEYVIFIDGDDWISPNLVCDNIKIAIEYNCDIVSFNHYLAYDETVEKYSQKMTPELKNKEYLELLLEQKISHNLWNKMYSKEFLDKSNFLDIPDITMGDDLVANIKLAVNNPYVIYNPKSYYYYYQRRNSVTREISEKVLEVSEAINAVEIILKNKNLFNQYKNQIEYLWFRHSYYCLVVLSRHKRSYIQKKLYKDWKKKKINIKKNVFCKEYINSIGKGKKILLYLYNFNYDIGYAFGRTYILVRDFFN